MRDVIRKSLIEMQNIRLSSIPTAHEVNTVTVIVYSEEKKPFC